MRARANSHLRTSSAVVTVPAVGQGFQPEKGRENGSDGWQTCEYMYAARMFASILKPNVFIGTIQSRGLVKTILILPPLVRSSIQATVTIVQGSYEAIDVGILRSYWSADCRLNSDQRKTYYFVMCLSSIRTWTKVVDSL